MKVTPTAGQQPICAKKRALGAADVFLEIITQPPTEVKG